MITVLLARCNVDEKKIVKVFVMTYYARDRALKMTIFDLENLEKPRIPSAFVCMNHELDA